MGSMCVSLCRCVFVSVVHPVAILNVVFCVICSLLRFVSYCLSTSNHTNRFVVCILHNLYICL